MNTKEKRRKFKKDRTWKHFLYWLNLENYPNVFFNFKTIENFNPEKYRKSFENYQTFGRKSVQEEDWIGVEILLTAQKQKEIFLDSLAQESMEFWSKGNGWIIPWLATLECNKTDKRKLDRLTLLAIIRTIKKMKKDVVGFFQRHPGIPNNLKQKYFSIKINEKTGDTGLK